MTSSWIPVLLAILGASHIITECAAEGECQDCQDKINRLARQLLEEQFYRQENMRTQGSSGIKNIRLNEAGTKPYHSTTYNMHAVASVHNHDNNIRTLGIGEVQVVLNGLEFRTRHNDYGLKMPHRTSKWYDATEDVPFPDPPPEVTQKSTVEEQIIEMREWFKAWRDQDYSVRDYRPYFKPVLCILEGAFIKYSENIEESFPSDRHFIDAATWDDLSEKIRYLANTGRKELKENLASLPRMIFSEENGTLTLGQWNYRIICHPLKNDLPLNRFHLVDDLAVRMAFNYENMADHAMKRSARFVLNQKNTSQWQDGRIKFGLLDELMAEFPGKDNYLADIEDSSMGQTALSYKPCEGSWSPCPLNAGYYHRWFSAGKTGALGSKIRARSFSDDQLFVALTTNRKVAGFGMNSCNKKQTECLQEETKLSYAIPLEVIYLTPLLNWNPYDITYRGYGYQTEGKKVKANGRNGGHSADKAYDGNNHVTFLHTPCEFYEGEGERDPADTAPKGPVGVLNSTGQVCLVCASGTRITTPNIPGVGSLRLRYPIMPVHEEGNPVGKEVAALKDLVMKLMEKLGYSDISDLWSSSPDNLPPSPFIASNRRNKERRMRFLDVTLWRPFFAVLNGTPSCLFRYTANQNKAFQTGIRILLI